MTQGRPVRQAEFAAKHGLKVKKQHRQKLEELGLIQVEHVPQITYSITQKAWAWLSQERARPVPRHSARFGPLYVTFGVIETLARRLGITLEEAMNVAAAKDDIREPEWIDADEYLARALQDISVFTGHLNRLREAAGRNLGEKIDRVELSAELVFQHVQLAARKRSLALEGQIGAEAAYDPVLFYSDDDLICGAPVRIRKPTVTRGHGKNRIIVQPGFAVAMIDG
jgi:DNA-binding PadR family transcriptional regulator